MTDLETSRRRPLPHVETWVFDLDNTLYPARHNLFELIDRRIGEFIAALLDLDRDAARRVQKDYFRRYGTTLRGLMLNHGVNPAAFLDFVHAIDIDRLRPSPRLARALSRLDGRKVIFTNGSTQHAERVTARLGVRRHIDAIFDIVDADYLPKPNLEAYRALLARHRIEPRAAAMVEDIARNLKPAAALGMTTVWVRTDSAWGREGSDGDHIDHVIDDLAEWLDEIVEAAPEL
ncbi:MAG: pyrimidine 5'-nucleotidase [Alphaproteobacteria bacterium]